MTFTFMGTRIFGIDLILRKSNLSYDNEKFVTSGENFLPELAVKYAFGPAH